MKLCLADTIFIEWKNFRFDNMEVNDFEILLIGVTRFIITSKASI